MKSHRPWVSLLAPHAITLILAMIERHDRQKEVARASAPAPLTEPPVPKPRVGWARRLGGVTVLASLVPLLTWLGRRNAPSSEHLPGRSETD